jgi:copper(I)-binding protein
MDPEALKTAEALAVNAARTHGVHVDQAQVQRALQDAEHGPAFAAWVNAHLGSDNLLSLDEMAL